MRNFRTRLNTVTCAFKLSFDSKRGPCGGKRRMRQIRLVPNTTRRTQSFIAYTSKRSAVGGLPPIRWNRQLDSLARNVQRARNDLPPRRVRQQITRQYNGLIPGRCPLQAWRSRLGTFYVATEIAQAPVLSRLAARNECSGADAASTIETDVSPRVLSTRIQRGPDLLIRVRGRILRFET